MKLAWLLAAFSAIVTCTPDLKLKLDQSDVSKVTCQKNDQKKNTPPVLPSYKLKGNTKYLKKWNQIDWL